MKIDIGGGHSPQAGYTNLDPVHGQGGWKRVAQEIPWPAQDNSVDGLRASHVMEHIPAGQPRIDVMNEAWRVLRIGHDFEVIVPLFPNWQAMADPTHVSYWVEQSFAYFDGRLVAQADYGMKMWKTVSFTVEGGWEGHWVGRK
jgi:predicted SAM-dependent methyltransferase